MKIFIIILSLFIATSLFAFEVTKEQYEDQYELHKILKAKYPEFEGLSGNGLNLTARGITDEQAIAEIEAFDTAILAKKQSSNDEKAKQDKLKEIVTDALKSPKTIEQRLKALEDKVEALL